MLDHTANSAVEDYTEDIHDQYPGNGFFPVFFLIYPVHILKH